MTSRRVKRNLVKLKSKNGFYRQGGVSCRFFLLEEVYEAERTARAGVYPAVSILPSLSRLMKDGIGEGYTREDHQMVSNQLFAAYAKVQDARSLASVIGEEELSDTDKAYLKFGTLFEKHFIDQGFDVNRTIDETLDLGWSLLSTLPKSELDRVDEEHLEHYYSAEKAKALFAED